MLTGKHDCVLFQRRDNKWKWKQGGKIQRYPKMGENVVVAYDSKSFSYTKAIDHVIAIDASEPNALEVIFQDVDAVWKLIFPAHANDINEIEKQLQAGMI